MAGEQAGHLCRGFQVAVGVALAAETGLVDRAAFADAGHNVLQHPSLGHMEQHVAGCDHGHASTGTLAGDAVQALRLTRAAVDGAGDSGTAWSQGAEVA